MRRGAWARTSLTGQRTSNSPRTTHTSHWRPGQRHKQLAWGHIFACRHPCYRHLPRPDAHVTLRHHPQQCGRWWWWRQCPPPQQCQPSSPAVPALLPSSASPPPQQCHTPTKGRLAGGCTQNLASIKMPPPPKVDTCTLCHTHAGTWGHAQTHEDTDRHSPTYVHLRRHTQALEHLRTHTDTRTPTCTHTGTHRRARGQAWGCTETSEEEGGVRHSTIAQLKHVVVVPRAGRGQVVPCEQLLGVQVGQEAPCTAHHTQVRKTGG